MVQEQSRTQLRMDVLFLVLVPFKLRVQVIYASNLRQYTAHLDLMKFKNKEVQGRVKLGVQAFADALLIIPKTLAANSGFDPIDCIVTLQVRSFVAFVIAPFYSVDLFVGTAKQRACGWIEY